MTTPFCGEADCVCGCTDKPSATLPWFALKIRSNFETTATNILQEKQVEAFFPTYRSRSYWSDRVKVVERPLFPGYVFCRSDPSDRSTVMTTPGVQGMVSFGGRPAQIDHSEIAALRLLMESSVPLFPHVFLRVGQRVSIERGPLAGLDGILTRFDSNCRIVVSVSLLQRSVSAQIDAEWVRAIE